MSRRLRRRYGRARVHVGAGGGRLRFGLSDPRKASSSMPGVVYHPSADGNYNTEREASAAIARFLRSP